MTKYKFKVQIFIIFIVLSVLFVVNLFWKLYAVGPNVEYYLAFKDSSVFILAIITTWMAYIIQQRISFVQHQRFVWSQLIYAVQRTVVFIKSSDKNTKDYDEILCQLSVSIDQIRTLYCNINGLYPYEPIKNIYFIFCDYTPDLWLTNKNEKQEQDIQEKITCLWDEMKNEFLKDFDRGNTRYPYSPFLEKTDHSEFYKKNNIDIKPS